MSTSDCLRAEVYADYLKKWQDLGLDGSALSTDCESVCFLIKERLIYTIVGIKNSSGASNINDHLQIRNGKLFLRKENKFIAVSTLVNKLYYDKMALQCVDKETGLAWNYFWQGGLVQADRCTCPDLIPLGHVTELERKQILEQAMKFKGLSFTEDSPPTCVFQVVTNPKKLFRYPDWFLFDGVTSQSPSHVYFHIIDETGDVYSVGFSKTAEENKYWQGVRSHFVTINGSPAITDWEDFQPHSGRRVTSFPMTKETCDKVLAEIKRMRSAGVRFNLGTENCSKVTAHLAGVAGVCIHNDVSAFSFISSVFPSVFTLSPMRKVADKVIAISHRLSRKTLLPSIEELYVFTAKVVIVLCFPLQIISSVALNILLLMAGAGRGSKPKEHMYGDLPQDRWKKVYAMINSPMDLFVAPRGSDSGHIIEWQDSQPSTLYHGATKIPSLNVLPAGGKDVPALLQRPYSRYHFERERRERLKELHAVRQRFFTRIFSELLIH